MDANEPAIFTGVLDEWPALTTWSLPRLVERAGDRIVTVKLYDRSALGAPLASEKLTVREFVALAADTTSAKRPYISEVPIDDNLPELYADVVRPSLLEDEGISAFVLFAGESSFTRFHYHPIGEAMLCQIVGDKRVVLIPPRQSKLIRQKSFYVGDFNSGAVEHADQLESLPEGSFDLVLSPGDCLYIPLHWWHCAYGLGVSISTTIFWRAALRRIFAPPMGMRYGVPSIALYRAHALPYLFRVKPSSVLLR